MPQYLSTDPNEGMPVPSGLIKMGTVDLRAQPIVKNPDGSTSTVDSLSVEMNGREVLLPTVTPDGRHLRTVDEAVAEFKKTGRHLGIFSDVPSANAFAKQLHEDYAAGKYGQPRADVPAEPWRTRYPKTAQVVRGVADVLPAAGAMAGGVVATPGTMGAGTLAGAALGAGAGRGLRDLIAEAIGAEDVTSPASKAGRIALDTAVTGAMPGVMTAARHPLRTAGEFLREMVPGGKRVLDLFGTQTAMARAPSMGSTLRRPPSMGWTPPGEPPVGPMPPALAPRPTPVPSTTGASAMQAVRELFALLKTTPQPAEVSNAVFYIKRGMDPAAAVAKIVSQRSGAAAGADPAAALAATLKTPSTADVARRVIERNQTGRWQP